MFDIAYRVTLVTLAATLVCLGLAWLTRRAW
jgi:hypothetical protein